MGKETLGQFGGRVVRKFSGNGKTFIAGAILSPEDVEKWPTQNLKALSSAGKVEWFQRPHDSVLDIINDEEPDEEIDSEDVNPDEEPEPVSVETKEKPKSARKRKPAKTK